MEGKDTASRVVIHRRPCPVLTPDPFLSGILRLCTRRVPALQCFSAQYLFFLKPTPCVNVGVQSQTIGRAPSVVEPRLAFREMMAAAVHVLSHLGWTGLDWTRSSPPSQMRRRTFDRKSMEFDQIDLPTLSLNRSGGVSEWAIIRSVCY